MAGIDVLQGVTLGIAVLGAALGVFNAVRSVIRDGARLRVQVVVQRAAASSTASGAKTFSEFANALSYADGGQVGLRITNIGLLDVTLSNVGLTSSGLWARRVRRDRIVRSAVSRDAEGLSVLPMPIKPRQSITIWIARMDNEHLCSRLKVVRRVYASTECGSTFFGRSALLRALRRRAIARP
ncbi:MAG: hypothetical protein ACRES5_05715 [Pseudomonas sp.]|uniref:hypothetical protein n=1 Tax=Stenotrophomonas sp. TaxID=69392 RepID=UPI003D6D9E5A